MERVHRAVTVMGRLVVTAVVAVVVTTSAAAVTLVPAGARTLGMPRISAVPSTVYLGDSTTISAADLTPLTDYQLQVCGNAGFGGSAVCNLASTSTTATSEIGQFVAYLKVLRPPAPCPCVVEAIPLSSAGGATPGTPGSGGEVSTPITIVGLPTSNPTLPPIGVNPSGLVVEQADLVGSRTWAEWFGGAPHRTLVLKLRDAGPDLIPSTPFVLRAGPMGHATQIVQAPVVPPLHPGQVVSYRVPVTFPVLAHGNYVVVGTLGNADQTVRFTVTTPLMPWGIVFLVGILVLVALRLLVRRFVRRRQQRTPDGVVGGPPETEQGGDVEGPPSPPGPHGETSQDGATGEVPEAAPSILSVGGEPAVAP